MKVLNLYSGLGGNRKKWNDCAITSVEINDKISHVYGELYPQDNLVLGDAHQYLLENYDKFDFIWSSPPCQSHSKMVKATRHDVRKYPDMKLYQEIIFLQNFHKGRWVVENVEPYYRPLISPSFKIGRHLFWTNFDVMPIKSPKYKGFITASAKEDIENLKQWLGIHYEGNIYYDGNHCPGQVLRNCVHPDVGEHIFSESKRTGMFYNL